MADVINLDERRTPESDDWDGYTCPECGGAWFTASVAFATNDEGGPSVVTAWAAPPLCIVCDDGSTS